MKLNADQVNNPVLKISREHDLIVEQLGELQNIMRRSTPETALSTLTGALPGFAEAMRQHFFFEERIFYPALLVSIPVAGIVERLQQLQKEHGIMEERIRFLLLYLQCEFLQGERAARLMHQELSDLIDMVKRHAITEITDVFPRINQNPLCLKTVLELAQREAEKVGGKFDH